MKKEDPETKRKKLIAKERKNNPLSTLTDAFNQARTGDFKSGNPKTTLVIIIILLIILFFLIK